MMFVFAMAGLSSRFLKEGYLEPKYKLPLDARQDVFDKVISPFLKYRFEDTFVFVYRDVMGTKKFLLEKIQKYDLNNVILKELYEPTSGQADTVFKCCKDLPDSEELLVFNLDTFHLNFKKIDFKSFEYKSCVGVLEVFEDSGANWSFALVEDDLVVKTSEKDPISNLASNGLYYFRSVELYKRAYETFFSCGAGIVNGEKYIAPLYNHLINREGAVKIKKVKKSDMIFCGTPFEYEDYLDT